MCKTARRAGARDLVQNFRRRWNHRVCKPTNIKRALAEVSPVNVQAFIKRLTLNMEGVKAYNVFNYEEAPSETTPRRRMLSFQ